jgi:succinate-semialdehyde dehydrogenase/glutarate-semialdehyde dehydrogenase
MKRINPATEEPIDTPENDSPERVESKLRRLAFEQWRQTGFAERSRLMKSLASVMRREKDRLAKLMAKEMGKPITGGLQEIEKCAVTCEWFAEHAPGMLAPREVASDARKSFVRFDPIGAVFAIMPWNFPFWQVMRFAAPSLMAGNVGVLKHAENVPGCAVAIEELFTAAGFPEGVFTTLLIDRSMA